MPYLLFDRSRLVLQPLSKRHHKVNLLDVLPLSFDSPYCHPALSIIAERMLATRHSPLTTSIMMMGAHVIKCGLSRFVIDLMEIGVFTNVAMNGAGIIHDWELALVGATSEDVARTIQTGEFGLWQETGRLNDVIRAAPPDVGLGEAVGRAILDGDFPHKDVSILAAGVRLGVPVTVHAGIGCDILHEHPNCDGAALGRTSYTDFLIFAETATRLEGGVLLNFGSAVMGPEVYQKALAMARNVARQEGREIRHFTTAVFDLAPWPLGGDIPSILVQGDHRETLPALRREIFQNCP